MDDEDNNSRKKKWGLEFLLLAGIAAFGFLTGRKRRTPRSQPILRPANAASEEDAEEWIARGIVGTARGELAKRFGPPVVASGGDYWQAETWYYPVDQGRRTGIAIRFNEHMATEVEFIRPPKHSTVMSIYPRS